MCRSMLAHDDWKFVNVFVIIDFHKFVSSNFCAQTLGHFRTLFNQCVDHKSLILSTTARNDTLKRTVYGGSLMERQKYT